MTTAAAADTREYTDDRGYSQNGPIPAPCGYLDDVECRPFIRLACMSRAAGNVTIVMPPWMGFIGNARSAPGVQ